MTEPEIPARWNLPEPGQYRSGQDAPGYYGSGYYGSGHGPPAEPVGYGLGHTGPLRRISGLGTTLVVLSGLFVVPQVTVAIAAQSALHHKNHPQAGSEQAIDQLIDFMQIVDVLGLVVSVALWVVGSLWLGRAYDNARALAPHRLRRGRVWVWLGWWVPIVSLWFPKTIVDDVWAVTSGQGRLARQKHTGLWWTLWVVISVISYRYPETSDGVPVISDRAVAVAWVLTAAMIIGFLVWVPIVRGLTAAQDELVHSRFGRPGPQFRS